MDNYLTNILSFHLMGLMEDGFIPYAPSWPTGRKSLYKLLFLMSISKLSILMGRASASILFSSAHFGPIKPERYQDAYKSGDVLLLFHYLEIIGILRGLLSSNCILYFTDYL